MFTHLLERTERERRGIALILAGMVTLLILAAWYAGFVYPVTRNGNALSLKSEQDAERDEVLSPLRTLGASFVSLTETIREELGGVFWGIGGEDAVK
jgi:hypothetical protein